MKVGNKHKLEVIKARAEQGRITYQLDQKYVEKLMIYYNYNEPTPPQKPYQAPPPQKPYQAPPPNTSNSCNSCGAKIIDNNQFCTECGAHNTSVQPPPQYQNNLLHNTLDRVENLVQHGGYFQYSFH